MNTGDQKNPNNLFIIDFCSVSQNTYVTILLTTCYVNSFLSLKPFRSSCQLIYVYQPLMAGDSLCGCCLQAIHTLIHRSARECWLTAQIKQNCPLSLCHSPSLSRNVNLDLVTFPQLPVITRSVESLYLQKICLILLKLSKRFKSYRKERKMETDRQQVCLGLIFIGNKAEDTQFGPD